jgi:hypothetical protein
MSRYIDGISSFLSDCGITVLDITGSSLGINLKQSKGIVCNLVVYPAAVEAVIFKDNALISIKSFSSTENINSLSLQVSRTISLLTDESTQAEINIVDYTVRGELLKTELNKEFANVELKHPTVKQNGLCDLAAEIAINSVCHRNIQIDLLHGHASANGQEHIFKKIAPKLSIAAIVLAVLIGLFFVKWHFDNRKIEVLRQQIKNISSEAEEAREIIKSVGYAKTWFDDDPRYLDILHELTVSFPEKEGVWLSTMAIDESMNQVITGKATQEESVLNLLDNLNINSAFENVKMLYMRKAGKNTDIVTFAINLKVKKVR